MTAASARLSPASGELSRVDAWWRAANYLAVGQIYLLDNPLLRRSLRPEHTKPRLLGHWGTTPGLTFVWAHLNRLIRQRRQRMLTVIGPGHGGPAALAAAWLEGTYSQLHPEVSLDENGMLRLFRQFSFPGGVPSHVSPQVPGSLHEGGELGYSLAHAYGAAFDDPGLVVACVVGDGEAETGPLAASWQGNKFLDPVRDGTVLPILHLNGYKIASPTVLARIPEPELRSLLTGYGYHPHFVTAYADEPHVDVHAQMALELDSIFEEIGQIRAEAKRGRFPRAHWPLLVLRTPKGWTGPSIVDGRRTEGSWRSHQVPLTEVRTNPEHLAMLEDWLRSYQPDDLFDRVGAPVPEVLAAAPDGQLRMSASPVAMAGVREELVLPEVFAHAVDPRDDASATAVLGGWLREVVRANPHNFRIFGPDETASNRLQAVFEVTHRAWFAERQASDDHLGPGGRVLEVLSEHLCQGWLEGYLLSGRHGLFNCYEAFAHIIDSMFNQHAKWLETSRDIGWRGPVASLNYLLTSHVWRQDHNGFSHQDPGFIDHVLTKSPAVVRVYLPPDANTLLLTMDHCMRSRDLVNVVVAGKQPAPQWLTMSEAVEHCRHGIGDWTWAGTARGRQPDVVLACAGDVPTLETLAAAALLREHIPDLKVRVVNVVDLTQLRDRRDDDRGLSDEDFDALFTTDRPVLFAYHGYPWLIHELTYRRHNHDNFHVRGYKEKGTTTTPFDMVMLNDLDRFRLVADVIDRVPCLASGYPDVREEMLRRRRECRDHTRKHGVDDPRVVEWVWPYR
ncbi:phosphoketolase family protein [Fodinicola acaciae]|uniref:phosphoketolase family protein n=1 Tax=Fodinicola acaciae TaxID=2681555 RepID=UPI0013D39C9C|nr:phosphoketolase family protein [Fodinicola acaciae]